MGVVKVDWEVSDLARYPDAYQRKLQLEWKLRRGEKVQASDLPDGFLGFAQPDFAYRRYRKLLSTALLVETGVASLETYSRLSFWANQVWAGVAMEWALRKIGNVDEYFFSIGVVIHKVMRSKAFCDHMLEVKV
jgi:hypothetical protein